LVAHTIRTSTAQQLGLKVEAELADLIEKQSTAVSHLERTLAHTIGAGERTFLMAKELALDGAASECPAIHDNEWPIFAITLEMNRLRRDFLAGTGFAFDEDGASRCCGALERGENDAHRWCSADEQTHLLPRGQGNLVARGTDFKMQLAGTECQPGAIAQDRNLDEHAVDDGAVFATEVAHHREAVFERDLTVEARERVVTQHQIGRFVRADGKALLFGSVRDALTRPSCNPQGKLPNLEVLEVKNAQRLRRFGGHGARKKLKLRRGPMDLRGVKFGKYRLLRRLATGGMAEIILAQATGLEGFEKVVVLKRILPQHAGDGQFIRMFLEEAKLAATLHHSNIAQVYEVGKIDDSYFFAMEYVPGVDVRMLCRAAHDSGAAIPLEQALTTIIAAASALHYAHEKQDSGGQPLHIVHRDVSPSNIFCGYDGNIKLLDFGIAKGRHHQETEPGNLKGKIAYMSPEQCQGKTLDRRSDVFALGAVLYEMTTSTRLFAGASDLALINQIALGQIEPPSARSLAYPPELEAIVMRALAADRD
jgi:hypothetical protein